MCEGVSWLQAIERCDYDIVFAFPVEERPCPSQENSKSIVLWIKG